MDTQQVVKDALQWLDENEPKWGLEYPIDKHEFIANLLERISDGPKQHEGFSTK